MIQKINSAIFSAFIYGLSCSLVLAQTAALIPNALQQYFDNNGDPLSSGTVGFYIPNTLSLKTIWQDANQMTVWSNPLTLDAGGKPPGASAGIYGAGVYRQIVKDSLGNLIWDAVTSATGSGGGGTSTGDGNLVGTIKPWAGIIAPNQYVFANGQEVSRSTFSVLFTAITQVLNVTCSNGSNTLTAIADTSSINVGSPLETTCVASGTVVNSKTANTVVMSNPATITSNTTAIFFPFGDGNGTTTFTLPDLRGVVIAGRTNMGGIATSNLTSTYFGTAPDAQGAIGGNQNKVLITTNLPPYTPSGTVPIVDPGHNHTYHEFPTAGTPTGIVPSTGGDQQNPASFTSTSVTGITASFSGVSQGGTSTPFAIIQPTITLNYIIKIVPDTNSASASGVTSLGGMTGDIACGTGVTCTGNIITASAFANVNADNVLLNATGSTGPATGQPVGNCAIALTYSTSIHAFGCNNSIVTSITAGTGLIGGTITTVGTIAADIATNSNIWVGTANKLIDAAGNHTSLAVIPLTISTATFTPNFNNFINFSITLVNGSCPCTLANPSNAYNGLSGFIEVIQSSSGNDLINTYGTTWNFPSSTPPVLSTGVNAKDILPFFCDNSSFCMIGPIQKAFGH